MSEQRLIDANEVLKRAIPVRGEYDDSGVFYAVPTGYIKGSPTIDPVKRGKWVEVPNKVWVGSRVATQGIAYECSECGYTYKAYDNDNRVNVKKLNYCPNCGAKMDKEG